MRRSTTPSNVSTFIAPPKPPRPPARFDVNVHSSTVILASEEKMLAAPPAKPASLLVKSVIRTFKLAIPNIAMPPP